MTVIEELKEILKNKGVSKSARKAIELKIKKLEGKKDVLK